MAGPSVEVFGLAETRAALGRLGTAASDPAIVTDAAELVAGAARDRVPVVSGALYDSIRVERALPAAVVIAGSPAVPYAGVIEYGWPDRGIAAQHYLGDAADDQADDVGDLFDDRITAAVVDVGRP